MPTSWNPNKNSELWRSGENSLVGSLNSTTHHSQREAVLSRTPWSQDYWKLQVWDSSKTHALCISLWLVLMGVLLLAWNCNCEYSPFLSFVTLANELLNLRGLTGSPEFVTSWSELKGNLGTPNLQLVSKMRGGGSCWRVSPSPETGVQHMPMKFDPTLDRWCHKSLQEVYSLEILVQTKSLPPSLWFLSFHVCTFSV